MDRIFGSVIAKRQWQVGEQAHRSFLSVSRRVTVACESAHNWIGALERGLRVGKCNEPACISSGRCSSMESVNSWNR